MNYRVFLGAFVCLLVSMGLARGAQAQQTPVNILMGVKGGLEMSATSEAKLNGQDTGFFPGFGFGPGFGISLEGRFGEVVGLETGLYYMVDDITGWSDKKVNGIARGRVTMEQETTALHIPILLKGVINTSGIRPFLGLGVEFVLQQSNSLNYRTERENANDLTIDQYGPIYNGQNRIGTANYTLLQLTTGVEIEVGPIRIPIEIRAGYNLGWDDSFEARITIDEKTNTLRSNGEAPGHFGFFTGVLYDYDFVL